MRLPRDVIMRARVTQEQANALNWYAQSLDRTFAEWLRSIAEVAIRQKAKSDAEEDKWKNPQSRAQTKTRSDRAHPVRPSLSDMRDRLGAPDLKAQAKKKEWAKKELAKELAKEIAQDERKAAIK